MGGAVAYDSAELPLLVGTPEGDGGAGEGAIQPPAPRAPEGARVTGREAIAAEILPHEESVEAHDVAADEPEPLAPGQRLERGERRAEVGAPLVPLVGRVVG